MFRRRRVSVTPGDVFTEALPGKKSIFTAMGVADGAPVESFASAWKVVELVMFNGLPHAKLRHCESGRERVIASDILERQEIYRKSA